MNELNKSDENKYLSKTIWPKNEAQPEFLTKWNLASEISLIIFYKKNVFQERESLDSSLGDSVKFINRPHGIIHKLQFFFRKYIHPFIKVFRMKNDKSSNEKIEEKRD